jgi:hypothetical protein
VTPLAGQSGQKVLVLGKLDLKLSLAGAGAAGKDVQDKSNTVDDFDLEGLFKVVLLEGGQLIVEDSDVVVGCFLQLEEVFQLALTEVMRFRCRPQALDDLTDDFSAGGFRQLSELFNRGWRRVSSFVGYGGNQNCLFGSILDEE